jgi:hypothetical protein
MTSQTDQTLIWEVIDELADSMSEMLDSPIALAAMVRTIKKLAQIQLKYASKP